MAIKHVKKVHNQRFTLMDAILLVLLTAFAVTIVFPFYTSIIVSIMFILEIGGMMGGHFDQIYNLQNDIVASEAETLALYIYRITFERKPDYGFSTAVSMFCSVINAVLMITANTVSKALGGGGLIGDVNNGH